MREQLLIGDWKEGINDKRTEEILKRIIEKFNQVIDKKCANNQTKQKEKQGPIRDKRKEKYKLSRKVYALKKQREIGEHDKIWNEYCEVRNKVRKLSKQARKDYENNIAKDVKKKNSKRV